jgi:hypothetical protein
MQAIKTKAIIISPVVVMAGYGVLKKFNAALNTSLILVEAGIGQGF